MAYNLVNLVIQAGDFSTAHQLGTRFLKMAAELLHVINPGDRNNGMLLAQLYEYEQEHKKVGERGFRIICLLYDLLIITPCTVNEDQP